MRQSDLTDSRKGKRGSRAADLLLFAEDPGAANYLAEVPAAMANAGWTAKFVAVGAARSLLEERGLPLRRNGEALGAADLVASVQPRVVVVGTSENPDTLGLDLVRRARLGGIPSVGVVDTPVNADFRFRGRADQPLAHAPDWIIVPDSPTREAYLLLGHPADRVLVCGHPNYDRVRSDASRLKECDRAALRKQFFPDALADQRVLVFVSEPSVGMNDKELQWTSDYSLHGWGGSRLRTEIVIEELLDALLAVRPRPYLVLRLHPKDLESDYSRFLKGFNCVSQRQRAFELVFATDCAVGMTSMLLMEAALIGRPSLAILPRRVEQAWLPSIAMGLTPSVSDRGQLVHAISSLLRKSRQSSEPISERVIPAGSLATVKRFLESLLVSSSHPGQKSANHGGLLGHDRGHRDAPLAP